MLSGHLNDAYNELKLDETNNLHIIDQIALASSKSKQLDKVQKMPPKKMTREMTIADLTIISPEAMDNSKQINKSGGINLITKLGKTF